jgi:trimeric autotransporter adhesin
VNAIALAGPNLYVGGGFGVIGGEFRNHIAAIDRATGHATSWDPDSNGTVSAITPAAGTVYTGGNFTSIGGQERIELAALDATTGNATSWNPDWTMDGTFECTVRALAVSGATVYVGAWVPSSKAEFGCHRLVGFDRSSGMETWQPPNAGTNALEFDGNGALWAGVSGEPGVLKFPPD